MGKSAQFAMVTETGEGTGEKEWSLYDLAKDVGEKENLADKFPVKVQELKGSYGDWENQLLQPKWIRQDNRRTGAKKAARKKSTAAERQIENRFKRLDRNSDGKLTSEEAKGAPRFKGAIRMATA